MAGTMIVTGASGYVGGWLTRRAAADGWQVLGTVHRGRSDTDTVRLDVADRAAVTALLARVRPDVVVHTAADMASGRMWPVIALGSGYVAAAASAVGARLVHLSSDAVLAGDAAPYDETAAPAPRYPYGVAKAAAEAAVTAAAPGAAIVRLPVVLGDGASKHERFVHDVFHGRVDGTLFVDRYRTPVHPADVAGAVLELATMDHTGLLNVAGPDEISWYEMGRLVAVRDGLDPDRLPTGYTASHPAPADTRLVSDRARALLTTRLRGVREFLQRG